MKYCIRTSCTKKCKSEIISIRYAMGAETLHEIIKMQFKVLYAMYIEINSYFCECRARRDALANFDPLFVLVIPETYTHFVK